MKYFTRQGKRCRMEDIINTDMRTQSNTASPLNIVWITQLSKIEVFIKGNAVNEDTVYIVQTISPKWEVSIREYSGQILRRNCGNIFHRLIDSYAIFEKDWELMLSYIWALPSVYRADLTTVPNHVERILCTGLTTLH